MDERVAFQGLAASGDAVFIDSEAGKNGAPPLKTLGEVKTMEQLLQELPDDDTPDADDAD